MYATQMLRLALEIVKSMGIERVLVTCDKDNMGSAKTIIKNGGILESEDIYDGVLIQRYWIDLSQKETRPSGPLNKKIIKESKTKCP